eukprot:365176-Chlamydomonas_euryale.AAC.7
MGTPSAEAVTAAAMAISPPISPSPRLQICIVAMRAAAERACGLVHDEADGAAPAASADGCWPGCAILTRNAANIVCPDQPTWCFPKPVGGLSQLWRPARRAANGDGRSQ